MCSGMQLSHYERFCKGANIGFTSKKACKTFFDNYKTCIEQEYQTSIDIALLTEVTMYDYNDWEGINIMTDGRHGWRKNAKDTSVVTVGEKTSLVIHHEHITKADDHVSQRHEKVGTERVYKYLENKEVPRAVHIHDRNMSINILVRDKNQAMRYRLDFLSARWRSER